MCDLSHAGAAVYATTSRDKVARQNGATKKVAGVLRSLPGTTATVLSARKTRNVRSADRLPSGNAIVMYLNLHFAFLRMRNYLTKS